MRNQLVAHIYGTGKSRSKPLRQKSIRNQLKQHRGYIKTMALYDAVIKRTSTPIKINMLKSRFAVKQGIQSMIATAKTKTKSTFKLNINK